MSNIESAENLLREGERIDDLQRDGLRIIQNGEKFCFGIDAVLLSDFANVKRNEKVLDIGTGTGIIPILLYAKSEGEHFTGLEIQKASAEMAMRSVKLNNIEDKVSIIEGDIKNALNLFERESFNVITSNPPYMIDSAGIDNENDEKTIARHEVKCTLDDIIREGSKLLKVNGRFYMVHRPFRLVEIFETFRKYHLEPKTMRMVHPFINKEPNMVLIEAIKGAKPRLKTLQPLIVYKEQGKYTDEIFEIYNM
ncbi:MAG: tRNA1(Val) (adenine(37)-N6)-methyltransferase [Lachnospiraceae bacterium]|nr:tRNA1(Val) (adenine(37)-N6)-methyltransferase [Lachnospiraceae bacterium]